MSCFSGLGPLSDVRPIRFTEALAEILQAEEDRKEKEEETDD